MASVGVKALAWTQKAPPGHEHEPFVYWAAGLGGHYRAERDGLLWMAHDAFVWKQCKDQNAAKAFAQADYERRILSSLTLSPAGVTEAKPKVSVKPLEWSNSIHRGQRVKSSGGLLSYTIAHGGSVYRWAIEGGGWSEAFFAYEHAIRAAQSDYEQRVLSALNIGGTND